MSVYLTQHLSLQTSTLQVLSSHLWPTAAIPGTWIPTLRFPYVQRPFSNWLHVSITIRKGSALVLFLYLHTPELRLHGHRAAVSEIPPLSLPFNSLNVCFELCSNNNAPERNSTLSIQYPALSLGYIQGRVGHHRQNEMANWCHKSLSQIPFSSTTWRSYEVNNSLSRKTTVKKHEKKTTWASLISNLIP